MAVDPATLPQATTGLLDVRTEPRLPHEPRPLPREHAASLSASGSAVPDVLAPGMNAVFCGINPGLASASAGTHFANPRNDFWRLLDDAGFTPRLLSPSEQLSLLEYGYGLTNAVARTTRGSGDLRKPDFAGAADRLARIADELRPAAIAFVGKEAYRGVFGERPEHGLQPRQLGDTSLFVLPSTSPANAAVAYARSRSRRTRMRRSSARATREVQLLGHEADREPRIRDHRGTGERRSLRARGALVRPRGTASDTA